MTLTAEDARRLLQSAVEGGDEFRAVVQELSPKLSSYILKTCRVNGSDSFGDRAHSSDDVVQEVLIKLLRSPPDPVATGQALPRLLSWLKVVTVNHLRDVYRRRSRRIQTVPTPDDTLDPSRITSTGEGSSAPDAGRTLMASQTADAMRNLFRRCQPACLPLFELLLGGEELSSEEAARRLRTSRANIDTLKRRLRLTREVWLALEDAPQLTAEEVSERIGRPANAELSRTLRKVRHYLAAEAVVKVRTP